MNYIIFKILPLLEEGVFIHFHDVFYPFEYPAEWVYEGRGWNEAYVLRAFLQYNTAFEIQFFNSFLIEKHRTVFESMMPLCLKRTGANLWLKKKRCDPELERLHDRKERRARPVPQELDLTRPEDGWCLKRGWYEPEPDHCWMTQSATFQIAGPDSARQRLVIYAVTPVTVHISQQPRTEFRWVPAFLSMQEMFLQNSHCPIHWPEGNASPSNLRWTVFT